MTTWERPPNILRGLIFCADCKRPLVRYKSVTNKGTNRYYVYICQRQLENVIFRRNGMSFFDGQHAVGMEP